MNNKSIDFLEIKKGKVKFECWYEINDRVEKLLFPNKKTSNEFYDSYEGRLYDVFHYVGYRIFNSTEIEVPTWYPLNGKDTYSLVQINHNKIINIGVDNSINYFIKHIERKIIEYSNLTNIKLDKSIELIKKSTSTLLDSKYLICKILFNKYWDIVYDDYTLDYTPNDVNYHIREEWEKSIEMEELRVKFIEKVNELCSNINFSKSESQKMIVEDSLYDVVNKITELNKDYEFNRKYIHLIELKELKLNLEKIKSLI